MNLPVAIPTDTLPTLIDKATAALEGARTSAEILEARGLARVAYDAAKSTARVAKAKTAHDSIVAEIHRTQAHALAIRARAEMRLAEEYDAAQDRGILGQQGRRTDIVPDQNEVHGFTRKDIHEARKIRDAERDDPGAIGRALDGMLERGEEPTRAALRRHIEKPKPQRKMDPKALWVWGRLKDFERDGILGQDPAYLVSEMTDPMRADVQRLLPMVREFLEELECIA